MNEDYLWDRTGEPDPEIQQLEDVLGTLRYQPRPLELPAQVRIGQRRTLFPRMAIAAAVATMLVGAAAWLLFQKPNAPVGLGSASNVPAVEKVKTPSGDAAVPAKDEVAKSLIVNETPEKSRNRTSVRKILPVTNRQSRPLALRANELTPGDRAEAQAAKEQLLLALRVASAKLSLAQKKAQVGYPGSLRRNQHKVG